MIEVSRLKYQFLEIVNQITKRRFQTFGISLNIRTKKSALKGRLHVKPTLIWVYSTFDPGEKLSLSTLQSRIQDRLPFRSQRDQPLRLLLPRKP